MMGLTDRHFRTLIRLLTRHTLLYTELVPVRALLSGTPMRALGFAPLEQPLALQLGGDDPGALAEGAAIAEAQGFAEVNLNAGCPSERVRQGRFGAALMARPDDVALMIAAMRRATRLPVTVKHRLGIAPDAGGKHLLRFVDTIAAAGVDRVIVHARAAVLHGRMSPKQNRRVPPLCPGEVYRLKKARPFLAVEYNGGVMDLDQALAHLDRRNTDGAALDGVMIGRAAYARPWLLAHADERVFGAPREKREARRAGRVETVRAFLPYLHEVVAQGEPLRHAARHLLNIFSGTKGARAWRRRLSEALRDPTVGPSVIEEALCEIEALWEV